MTGELTDDAFLAKIHARQAKADAPVNPFPQDRVLIGQEQSRYIRTAAERMAAQAKRLAFQEQLISDMLRTLEALKAIVDERESNVRDSMCAPGEQP